MIHRTKEREGKPQGIRHEWVTVLMLHEKLREWLQPAVDGNDTDMAIVEWSVAGHHPAYDRPSPPRHADLRGEGDILRFLVLHDDFKKCLNWLKSVFPLGPLREFAAVDVSNRLVGTKNVFTRIQQWFINSRRMWEALSPDDRRFVAAVKNTLIAADVAGSAIPREVPDEAKRWMWITEAFKNTPQDGELRDIVTKRIEEEQRRNNDPKTEIGIRPFQDAVAATTSSALLVKAGCGSGKTLLAYHWAATQFPRRRLYFCYPTTGTATEGYKDYLHNPEEQWNYRLFHGRAEVDLAGMTKTGTDQPNAEAESAARIESLDAWGTPIVSCTVDTVLGIVQNNRRGLFAWPALAGGAFVFDEIHAYDNRLFGALLRFLQDVPGVPVLLMTASLPKARETALKNCLRAVKRELAIPEPTADLKAIESQLRYHREATADPVGRVQEELGRGGKVLWVANTVSRAMATAHLLQDHSPRVYHSRFRYVDRVKRHTEVVNAFKPERNDPVVACCTQVAEMSLDLKGTTLLVAELAPVPALIQRLGRLAREARDGEPTRPFVVVDVGEDHLPYAPAELEAARRWLARLEKIAKSQAGGLSQADLAAAWQSEDAETKPDFIASAWQDGGPSTTVLELREASPGITVVLEEDFPKLKRYAKRIAELSRQGKKPTEDDLIPRQGEEVLARMALPMPPPPKRLEWRLQINGVSQEFRGIPVARNDAFQNGYNPKRGGEWRKL